MPHDAWQASFAEIAPAVTAPWADFLDRVTEPISLDSHRSGHEEGLDRSMFRIYSLKRAYVRCCFRASREMTASPSLAPSFGSFCEIASRGFKGQFTGYDQHL